MLNVANVAGVQVTNVGSPDITSDILLRLSKQINEVVCNDPTMAGAVVTHGTDTLEESAFFLDATVNCRKPVVIVGAMRPSTAISADGPLNLLQSVTVATSPKARDRGALIVMNDRIVSAFYASKTNANTVDTFKAIEMGNLGEVVSNKPYFFYPPVKPTGKTEVDIRNITSIPRVDILYSYEDMHNDTLYSAIDNGAKGIVVSLVHSQYEPHLSKTPPEPLHQNTNPNKKTDRRLRLRLRLHPLQRRHGRHHNQTQHPHRSQHAHRKRGGAVLRRVEPDRKRVFEPCKVTRFAWLVACPGEEY